MLNTKELPLLGAVLHTYTISEKEYRRGLVIGIFPPAKGEKERRLVVIEDQVKFRAFRHQHGLWLSDSDIEDPETGLTTLHLADIPSEYQDQWEPEFQLEGFCHVFH